MDRTSAKPLIGTCSWTDRSLIACGRFYPAHVKTPEARIQFYACHFPVVEVDSSYYALPSDRVTGLWVERTPGDFVFDIKAYALFTHHPAKVASLPRDIREQLPKELQEKNNVYQAQVPEGLRAELWRRYREALLPLDSAGKLGLVVFQFPHWFLPGKDSWSHILSCQERLPQYRLAIEFRNTLWLDERHREDTLRHLRERGLALVCVDEPQGFKSSVPPAVEATSDIAIVRFHGRNAETWEKRGISASDRFDYYYSREEMRQWVPRVRYLQEKTREVHLLMNTNKDDQGVVNARLMASLLNEEAARP